jgi:hypothetical protein
MIPGKLVAPGLPHGDPTRITTAPANLGSLSVFNRSTAARYVKLYDKAGRPSSTDTPVQVYPVPGAGTAGSAGGAVIQLPQDGLAFSAGIAMRVTTGVDDTDDNSAGSQEVIVNYGYSLT